MENIRFSSPPLSLDNYFFNSLTQKNPEIHDSSHYHKSKLLIFFLSSRKMDVFIYNHIAQLILCSKFLSSELMTEF